MNTAVMSGLGKYRDFALLVLRLGIGVAFVVHGYPKMAGGPEVWTQLGQVMGMFHLSAFPAAWGFAAAFAELGGGILLILGLFARPAAFLLVVNMAVATAMHIHKGDGFNTWSHAGELCVVFLALLFLGPGRYSVDGK